ncbi:Glu-tRNA(Gln) amidotransferase subunit GatD [Candidatus Woesearchaeota archaeon]|nr:Glu-tRNA(Gln) amidotransferase subunit GatD [Candidatus Woesearchaeota archaeon]
MKPEPGDRIEVITDRKKHSGVLIPTPELTGKDSLILKLENGYNIGISKKKIKNLKILKKYKKSSEKSKKTLAADKNLPTISILHTGGTIASKVDYRTGGVIAAFTPEEILTMFPELKDIANIKSRLIRNMWSEDMRFSHYNLMAREVKKEIDNGADGVIITHGTDTLHYTGAALSFILKNLNNPVILVGSQRSSDRGSTDASMNLICASRFIADSDYAGVGICMHAEQSDNYCDILKGTKSRKMHTSRRDAFKPVNSKPVAKVFYDKKKIEFYEKEYSKKSESQIKLKKIKPDLKIGILKSHPNMYAQEVDFYKGFDGLVLEGTGLGQMPISKIDEPTKEHAKIFDSLKELIDSGTIVVMSPQTIFGRLQMNVYAPARKLQKIGVLGNFSDMTPETTFIKLAWLLSNHPKKKVKKLITKNLRGEISERITPEEYFKNIEKLT